jgi:transposase-like protein
MHVDKRNRGGEEKLVMVRRVATPDGEPAMVATAEGPTRRRWRQRTQRGGTKTMDENQHRANKNKQKTHVVGARERLSEIFMTLHIF